MTLTDVQIRKTTATGKTQRLFDGGGLYLEVSPSGSKWWRAKYRYAGREKRLSLGVYPDVGLKKARNKLKDLKDQLEAGLDPGAERKLAKVAKTESHENTFEVLAREWFERQKATWAESHSSRLIRQLERDIFPWLGDRPIGEIKAPELLAVLRRVEQRGAVETAHRSLSTCGQIFRYAIATARAERDPSGDLKGALTPAKTSHFAATTEPDKVGEMLRAIYAYQGTLPVTCALKLAPHVFVRPGELRHARWSDIDLEAAEWRFTAEKTKTPHIVPLSRQAVAILNEVHPLTSNYSDFVFPTARNRKGDRPMSDNAILAALRSLGIEKDQMTGHGWRAVARTLLDEVLGFRAELIEQQLAHAVRDVHGRAYNRTQYLNERRDMMQKWSDYLDTLRA